MATGYTRQSSAQIVNGNVINDSDFNNEYNQVQSAFSGSSGHDHSGGIGLGPRINLTATTPGVTGVLDAQFGGVHTAAADPTVTSDSANGYVKGATWVNTSTHSVFECADDTPSAAIWTRVSSIAGTANQITTATVSGLTTLALSSTLVIPGTLTSTAGNNVLGTTQISGLTTVGIATMGGITNTAGSNNTLTTTQITGLTTAGVATMAGLTSSGLITANGGLTVNTGATGTTLSTTQIAGLTTTQVLTASGGLTVSTSTNGAVLNTTSIAGLQSTTLSGLLTAGTQTLSGGKYKGSTGTVNALGSITGSNAIDYSLGNVVTATQNAAAITFTFTNWPASGTYGCIELVITLDSTPHTVTITGVSWDSATGAPTLVASKVAHILCETVDGGSTVRGSFIGCF